MKTPKFLYNKSNYWQKLSLENILQRFFAAESIADRGTLLREVVRLSEDTITLEGNTSLINNIPLEKFSLKAINLGNQLRIHCTSEIPGGIPRELRRELRNVLTVDTSLRRPDSPASADPVLLLYSPYEKYRNPTQKVAVRALVTMPQGSTLCTTMATGTGKSLLFQLGTLFWRDISTEETKPVSVVLVPTVSLALDHEASAKNYPGLENSKALTGDHDLTTRREITFSFRQGNIPLLFVSPEMALGSLREILMEATLPVGHPNRPAVVKAHILGLFIDEVHIVATWGRTFRPEFQRIPGLVQALRKNKPELKTILLSATIDDETLSLLRKQYGDISEIGKDWLEIAESVPRREFDFIEHYFNNKKSRDEAVLTISNILPRPALIYTTEVEHAEELYSKLISIKGYKRLAVFTGQTGALDRRQIVTDWRNGDIDLVIATSAFGMGVDHRNVRAVVHACLPESASRYYQEISRAGRDGYQAFAILLYCREDVKLASRLAVGRSLTIDTAIPRWQALLESACIDGSDYLTGRPIYQMDLRSEGEQLSSGPSGQRNIVWNKSLLIQLQRYGTLEVISDENDQRKWGVVPSPNYPDLWETGTAEEALRILFNEREEEEKIARDAIDEFRKMWRDKSNCRLTQLFEMVETGKPFLPACGRCPVCREKNVVPDWENIHGGTDKQWKLSNIGHFDGARLLVVSEAHIRQAKKWVNELTQCGAKQFIVPDHIASTVAKKMKDYGLNSSWLITWSEVNKPDGGIVPLNIDTAIVLDSPQGLMADRVWKWAVHWVKSGGPLRYWVAPPNTKIQDRWLEDIVTNRPPISILEDF